MNNKFKTVLIGSLVILISLLHYATQMGQHYFHIFYREMYFLPIILGGFWFGLRGGLLTSLGITALYLPFVLTHWQGFSPTDLNKIMEILLFNVVAVVAGYLRDRELAEQERSIQSKSLAAMGRAVSGVAHDMKTPLIAIGGFAQQVRRKLSEDDPSYKKLGIVIQETQRLEDMVKEMLDFSRPLELDCSEEDLNQVVENSLDVVQEQIEKRDISIRREPAHSLPSISLDAARIEQVVINLVMNAVQASPEGGEVTVRTSRMNEYLAIDVTDCGCGIPPHQKEEIFTPFFSTKKGGTGLGLPIVKKIVEAHAGRLELFDNPQNGVTFRVLLPVAEK